MPKKSKKKDRFAKMRERRRRQAKMGDTRVKTGAQFLDLAVFEGEQPSLFKINQEKGKNYNVDIIPFLITQPWVKDLRDYNGHKNGAEIGDPESILDIPIHRNLGPNNQTVVCPYAAFKKPCPACIRRMEEWEKGEEDRDEKLIKSLNISWRSNANVVDEDGEDPDEIQVWANFSHYNYTLEILEEAKVMGENGDGEPVAFDDPEEGGTLRFDTKIKKLGKNKYAVLRSVEIDTDREPYDMDIIEDAYPLDKAVVLHSFDEIKAIMLGLEEESQNDDSDEEDEEKPRRGRKSKKKKSRSRKKKAADNECPFGHVFGEDCQEEDECDDCPEDIWEACSEAKDKGGSSSKGDNDDEECPEDYEFGEDFDTEDECDDCELRRACKKANEASDDDDPEEEEERPRGRRSKSKKKKGKKKSMKRGRRRR
jgi:hypothetical protein